MATIDSTMTPRYTLAGGLGRRPPSAAGALGAFGRGLGAGAVDSRPIVPRPQPDPSAARSSQIQAALGLTAEQVDERRKETGVDPGATGYVSGQVPPTGRAMAALGGSPGQQSTPPSASATAPTGSAPPGSTGQGGTQSSFLPPGASGNGGAQPTQSSFLPPGASGNGGAQGTGQSVGSAWLPGGDTTTTQSALTSGAAAPPMTAPPRGDVSTRTGEITNNTGTTSGKTPVPTGSSASPTVWAGEKLGIDVPDPGSDLVNEYLQPTLADLSPALNSQRAAFGIQDDLTQERYDYRPGAAAAQDAVSLNKQQADETRARQMAALGGLEDAAAGRVPSAAELQMRAEAGRNVAATLGQARALGGRSAGGAARAGTLASADILSRNSIQGAQLRAAEQDRNRQALTQAALGIRGQDVDTASQDARLLQDQRQNNLQSQIEQNRLAEQHRQALLDAQLKALGIGAGSGNAAVGASGANAAAQNKFQGGVFDLGLGAFGL